MDCTALTHGARLSCVRGRHAAFKVLWVRTTNRFSESRCFYVRYMFVSDILRDTEIIFIIREFFFFLMIKYITPLE